MKRRTKAVLIGGGLAAVAVVATVAALSAALAKNLDRNHYCETGFSSLTSCTLHWSTRTTSRSTPIFTPPSSTADTTPPSAPDTFEPRVDVTMWAVAHCPQNAIARRLLCATPSIATPVSAENGDLAAPLPLPKPWLVRTAKNSPFIESIHVETPLTIADTIGFYRAELGKRGWTENAGAIVEPDRATIAYTTSDGPATLRLIHHDHRTIADLSLRKPAAADAGLLPRPGQVRLKFGNGTDDAAVITIDAQTVELAARAGGDLNTGHKSAEGPEIDLPPGRYKVALKLASGAAQNAEFEVAADETWGLVVGPDGVPLPMRLY